MLKFPFLIAIALALMSIVGCSSFSRATKEYSATFTPIHSAVLTQSMVMLQHHKSVVDSYIARKKAENPDAPVLIQMTNPLYDPTDTSETAEPQFVLVDAQVYADEIQYNIDKLEELAVAQNILNESIQADKGLAPLLEGIKEVMSDEELIELIRRYGGIIFNKPTE